MSILPETIYKFDALPIRKFLISHRNRKINLKIQKITSKKIKRQLLYKMALGKLDIHMKTKIRSL
jgi:hypothetical protein